MKIEQKMEEAILERWEHFCDGPPPEKITFSLLPSFISRELKLSPAIFMASAFSQGNLKPVFVVKIQRDPSVQIVRAGLEFEFEVLKKMSVNPGFGRFVPLPVFSGVVDGRTFNIETIVKGVTLNDLLMKETISKEQVASNLYKVLDLLLDLYRSTRSCEESHRGFYSRVLLRETDIFSRVLKDYSDYFKDYFRFDPDGPELPLYSQHGDLFVSNILFNDGNITGLIDYEDFAFEGLPMGDLYNFLVTYIFSIKRTGVDKKISFGDWYADAVGKVVVEYAKLTGIPKNIHDELFRAYLLSSINREMKPHRNSLELAVFLMNSFKDKPKNIFDFMKNYLNM